MKMRASSEKHRASLKTAFRICIEKCGGGKTVAETTRVNDTMLSLYGAPYDETRWAGVDVVLDVDLTCGEPVVTRALASAQGYILIKHTPDVSSGDELGLADFQRILRETNDFQMNLLSAIADRKITPAEKEALLKDISDAEAVYADIRRKVVTA